MANLSVRRLDDETVGRLKTRAAREGVSLEETVRRALRAAVADEEPIGAMIRRHVGAEGADIELPDRELGAPIDFSTNQYDPGKDE